MPTSRYQSGQVPRRPLLDNFRLADRTKAEESRHIDAARLRDRALQRHQAPCEDIRRLSDRMMIDSSPEIGVA